MGLLDEGCFAFNASHDYGLCQPCDANNSDQNDLAGMGTGCTDLYSVDDTSCLGSGRVDTQNGSECAFTDEVMTGVVCCQGAVSAPAMSPAPLLVTMLLLLLAGVAASRRGTRAKR